MDVTAFHPELTPQCWAHVFSQLQAPDAARAACVQKLWRDLVHNDDQLWKHFMDKDLGFTASCDASGNMTSTLREAYGSWRRAFGPEYWPYLPRAITAWERMKDWLSTNHPAIRDSIQPGLTEEQIREVEATLGFNLPPAIKVLYRLHDGQALKYDVSYDRRNTSAGRAAAAQGGEGGPAESTDDSEEGASIFHGLFGGYSVYSHLVVTRMMPLRRAAMWRAEMQLHNVRPTLMPFACSFRVQDKMFLVDTATGCLSIMRRRQGGCSLQPAGPQCPAASSGDQAAGSADAAAAGPKDGVLMWFEEYANRLAGGWYEVATFDEEYPIESRAISLFPLASPGMVEAVTRGVRVRASVVYVPEGHPLRHMFAYSIRYALHDSAQHQHRFLAPGAPDQPTQRSGTAASGPADAVQPPGVTPSFMGSGAVGAVQQCQLMSRHWIIRDERGQITDEVRGEGVIGKFPVLKPGEPEFVYCSCTHQQATRGSMEGEFQFVEGTISRQTGPVFDVICPTFRLDVPEFVF